MTQAKAPAQIGLNQETTLLINQSREGACGVDLPAIPNFLLKIIPDVDVKTNKIKGYKRERNTFQSEIYLDPADATRFQKLTSID